MTVFEPKPAAGAADPRSKRDQVLQRMVDLQFLVRDALGDLFSAPGSETVRRANAAIEEYLAIEDRFVLTDPQLVADLRIEPSEILEGQRKVREALNRVVWSDRGTFALARYIEDLRHTFLDHGTLYWQRTMVGRTPSGPRIGANGQKGQPLGRGSETM